MHLYSLRQQSELLADVQGQSTVWLVRIVIIVSTATVDVEDVESVEGEASRKQKRQTESYNYQYREINNGGVITDGRSTNIPKPISVL